MSREEAVGFIGLGHMGMGMARYLVAARYDVLAYDVRRHRWSKWLHRAPGRQPRQPRSGKCADGRW